jgi:hypothetical protein
MTPPTARSAAAQPARTRAPIQRDAEQEAAGQVGGALDLDCVVQQADVAGGGNASGRGEDVVDVAGVFVSDGGRSRWSPSSWFPP